jgi:MFS family permease
MTDYYPTGINATMIGDTSAMDQTKAEDDMAFDGYPNLQKQKVDNTIKGMSAG